MFSPNILLFLKKLSVFAERSPEVLKILATLCGPSHFHSKFQNKCCFPLLFSKLLPNKQTVRQIYVNSSPHSTFDHRTVPKQSKNTTNDRHARQLVAECLPNDLKSITFSSHNSVIIRRFRPFCVTRCVTDHMCLVSK